MSRARKVVLFFGSVLIAAAAVFVPVASSPPTMPWKDNLQGYNLAWAIPQALHLDIQHYWTALFTLCCLLVCALMCFE